MLARSVLTGGPLVRHWKMARHLVVASVITPSPDLVNMFLVTAILTLYFIEGMCS